MQTYQRKRTHVEARQHEGPKAAVVSKLKGNQEVHHGDYLVTDPEATEPRGSVYVVPKADFERDFEPGDGKIDTAATTNNDVAHKILASARDALRSYQFGNSSPDLAKQQADVIMSYLNEDTPGVDPKVPIPKPPAAPKK